MEELLATESASERVEIGKRLLASHALDDEGSVGVWEALECVALAAVEVTRARGASRDEEVERMRAALVRRVVERFKGSERAQCLRMMEREVEAPREAREEYERRVAANGMDQFARKRLALMYKQEGQSSKAIEALCKYLEDFEADGDAWRELGRCYVAARTLDKAAYCMEEALLTRPKDVSLLSEYADLLMLQNRETLARRYYCLAAEELCTRISKQRAGGAVFVRLHVELAALIKSLQHCLDVDKNNEADAPLRSWCEKKMRACMEAMAKSDGDN